MAPPYCKCHDVTGIGGSPGSISPPHGGLRIGLPACSNSCWAGAVRGGTSPSLTGVRVLREYERWRHLSHGTGGAIWTGQYQLLLPFGIDAPRIIDVRTKAIQIAPQEVTRGKHLHQRGRRRLRTIASPRHAILEVEDYIPATLAVAATTLRAVLGKMELDDILVHRDAINGEVRTILDTRTEQWGWRISAWRSRTSSAQGDAASHGPAGGGRARTTRQGHRRGR